MMSALTNRLWLWFWHLLPANPILVRVVMGASKRPRHLWLRVAYLSALLLVVFLSLFPVVTSANTSLTDLAKGASQTFKWAATTQLLLMSFMAPIFTAGAISQERDSQTFNILLSTPLTNAQIVFGSLMSRLYFVLILLFSSLPIFLVTMVWGGVTTSQIVESFALAMATAVLTGALAIFVAMMGVGTRRTIFSFYLLIALYLLSIYLLGHWDKTWVAEAPLNGSGEQMSWLTPLHPFLSLEVALNRIEAPPYGHLVGYADLARRALAHPSAAYVTWTLGLAFLLTLFSIFFVRRGSKLGEATIWTLIRDHLRIRTKQERTQAPRNVWNNPVAWREAKTRASGGTIIRWAIIGAGAIGMAALFAGEVRGGFQPGEVQKWVAGLIAVQFALAMIIATNTSATAMTKEKESQTLDLLMVTPLTSQYILWGKLRGLVTFTAPLVVIPILGLILFGMLGLASKASSPVIWIETGLELAGLMTLFIAGACVIGLKVSLTARTNVSAVMYSLGLLILLCALLSGVGFALTGQIGGEFGAFFAPFTPFTAILYLVDPLSLFAGSLTEFSRGGGSARVAALIGSALAILIYIIVIWSAYSNLVRGFDMIMRKQSGR